MRQFVRSQFATSARVVPVRLLPGSFLLTHKECLCPNIVQVWVTGVKQQSQSGASSPPPPTGSCPSQLQLLFDDVYERHIEHHWEPHVAKQVGNTAGSATGQPPLDASIPGPRSTA